MSLHERPGKKQWAMPLKLRFLVCFWMYVWTAGLIAATDAASMSGSPYSVRYWTTDHGLPQNTVTTILQSRDGYLWFGTLNGLVRFDGLRFTVFDESNTSGLNSSRIVRLFEDSQCRLWIGTESGGVAYLKDGQLVSLPIGQGSSDKRLSSICEAPDGSIWLYTMDGQVWRYANDKFDVSVFALERSASARFIVTESAGSMWISADNRLALIKGAPVPGSLELPIASNAPIARLDAILARKNGGSWRLADGRIQKWGPQGLEHDYGLYPWGRAPVSAVCEDRKGNLVVGTLGVGLFWFDAEGRASWLSASKGLSRDVVLSLCVDREDNLWVGTDGGGLNRLRRQYFEVLDNSRGLPGNAVQSVCEDGSGNVWIALIGGGVVRWRNDTLKTFGPQDGLVNLYAWSLLEDRDHTIWCGTWGAGLFRYQSNRFERVMGPDAVQRVVSAIFQDRKGRLWFGTQNGLVCREQDKWTVYTTQDGLSAHEVRAIVDDAEGNLWIGTVGGGLNRLANGKFTAFRKTDGFPSNDISSLLADPDGVLWIGTPGSGLIRYQNGRWTRCTTREGLASNSIGYLVDDGLGNLWIGSNAGIMRVAKRDLDELARGSAATLICRVYRKEDGLPTLECTTGSQPSGWRGQDGRLHFPTIAGLVTVRPDQLRPNPIPPPIVIESVMIDGRNLSTNNLKSGFTNDLVLTASQERIKIDFTCINLAAPELRRFKYRMDGYESRWNELSGQGVATYTKLPPGNYSFHVQACNEDGVWNENGPTLNVTVQPPFWRTWWFIGATILLLIGAVSAVVHFLSTQKLQRQLQTMKQQEALEKERSRIAQDIHDQLGASLTQMALLGELISSDKDYPDDVEAHSRQIRQTARDTTRTLDEIVWAVNPSNDTLESLVNYLCKYAQDYLAVAGLRYRMDVPEQTPNISIQPDHRHNVYLTFKEAITNIVRHAKASEVWLHVEINEQNNLVIEIEDNGKGLPELDEKTLLARNGLRGMRRRMMAIRGGFHIGPRKGPGTLVRLVMPLS